MKNKINIYQVFTRLFGNTNTTNTPWGTMEQNGCGKFSHFTDKALSEIHKLGISHIWYTGVPHHAVIRDYREFGISSDHPSVVKGRAGSPYAVKDYYQVNPDLANDPANRMQEFEVLIERTHNNGMKVIIDIVPNHVARRYEGLNNPEGVRDFGADDDTNVEYHRDNNFYYIPNQGFELPSIPDQFSPLGGEGHPDMATPFQEYPAKWTGNGSRLAKPDFDDWYETVKVNYGVRPDGTKDFPELPNGYEKEDHQAHFEFWQQHDVPSSWIKFRDIALFWIDKGVDGFRYDMAEMVPVEFWSFMNSSIKQVNPDAFLMAEVYQPDLYRDYIHLGKMDALYDKVDLYDGLKAVMQGKASTKTIGELQSEMLDIEQHMLHFLDNHDEQRVAAPEFAGDMEKGRPAMLVSALLSRSPTMIYFGQEVGEAGKEEAGFGQPSRTSIFDYIGVPEHQKWMNNGKFDGEGLPEQQKQLRSFYRRILTFAQSNPALLGEYYDLYPINEAELGESCHLFARTSDQQLVLGVSNFSDSESKKVRLLIPADVLQQLPLKDGRYTLQDEVGLAHASTMMVEGGQGVIDLKLKPLAASAYCLNL
ncbi:alpha-amylase family protein [Vibrio maerlii]|uniref:alpha-amylase family protein n=1 Tax=Vibrio maerlii TaxID=2231648 RepID=UPI000E3BBCA3|nr:alpha-amylase family protein [Vibrio maerlii]